MCIFFQLFKKKMAALLGLFLLVFPMLSPAAPVYSGDRALGLGYMISAKRHVSLNQAVSMVQRRTGGRILSATTRHRNGQTLYVIKVLTRSGVVRVYRVDTHGNFR